MAVEPESGEEFGLSLGDIRQAQRRISEHIFKTPVLSSGVIDAAVGATVFFKPEGLQKTGSFKLRGATNAILQIENPEGGVVAYSSGNHGKALAYIGQKLGIPVTLVLQNSVEVAKLDAANYYGARVVQYDPATQNRVDIAKQISSDTGAELIPPYDNERVIAGQGTTALEFLEQAQGLDALLVPVGGGGLIAGCAIAVKGIAAEQDREIAVYGAEPVTGDDVKRSLESGSIEFIPDEAIKTICAGLRTNSPGEVPFPYIKKYVNGVLLTDDLRVREAMRMIWDELKLAVEPAGALALATLIEHAELFKGKKVGVIICGSNISQDDYFAAMKLNPPIS